MARIAGARRAGIFVRLVHWFARRRLGVVPEPLAVMAHAPAVLAAVAGHELLLERARFVDTRLKVLASLKAAALVGCPF